MSEKFFSGMKKHKETNRKPGLLRYHGETLITELLISGLLTDAPEYLLHLLEKFIPEISVE